MTSDNQKADISGKSTISEVSGQAGDGMSVARLMDTYQMSSESTDDGLDDVTDSRSDIQVEYTRDKAAREEERVEYTLDIHADTESRGSEGDEGVIRGPLLSDTQGSTVPATKSESEAILNTEEIISETDSITNFESKINTGIEKVLTLNPLEEAFNNQFARRLGPPKPSNSQRIKLRSFSFGRFSII